jgi:hypothetical protein
MYQPNPDFREPQEVLPCNYIRLTNCQHLCAVVGQGTIYSFVKYSKGVGKKTARTVTADRLIESR